MPSLPEAVESKYGKPFFDMQIVEVACVSLSLRGCGRFRPPSVLILAGCDIEEAGDENELRQQCEGVTELDLSKNKFKTWEEVFKILQFVPGLMFLNLSYNAFENSCSNSSCGKFHQLSKLVLNGTGLAWKDVYSLLALAPSLEELHLCLNGYSKVEKSNASYKTVKRLHFNCNPISEWSEIELLGYYFPSLEILILADCPLESLNPECRFSELFPRLKYLSLNNSKIRSWDSIDQINKFPLLLELRLHQCPLFENYEDMERRNLTIARLEFIKRLNGGANITSEEKENAERCYIRHYLEVDKENQPQRYFELVSRHGHLNPLVDVSLKPQKAVQVAIKHEQLSLHKTLSVYKRVSDIKKLIAQELGVTCAHMRVFYIDKANGEAYAPEEIKINNKQLYTLNVNSGDEFIIDFKNADCVPIPHKPSDSKKECSSPPNSQSSCKKNPPPVSGVKTDPPSRTKSNPCAIPRTRTSSEQSSSSYSPRKCSSSPFNKTPTRSSVLRAPRKVSKEEPKEKENKES